ncbi:DUF465 domain protein [Campylobacter avium LMG 24591]|uniref:DUF465 domain protein n=1 Tax=Campylobacter avium LMG 24591 TaxID=522484 RepID=A0A222MW20_9BACT|nr:YdcH family protein [Campylobacter avium]ASQ30099.1 DUF465 domain protein [Campylobacter avium LMG 24591]OYD79198.1 hypothetical protein CAV8706_0433 [Campylobacter avium]HJE66806.1 YdcH family protein [Campylobacter avium]
MWHEYRALMTELKGKDRHFDSLFEKHNELDDKIKDAEENRVYLDDIELTKLKKEKLRIKEELGQYLASLSKK